MAGPPDRLAASAEENFTWHGVQCHGPEGKGDGINSVDELPVGPMNLSKAITRGGPVNSLEPLMPPWGNTLSQKGIKALMKFVRTLCKEPGRPN